MYVMSEVPPMIRFEAREVEDRTATIANGYYTPKLVDFVIVTPAGGRDEVERVATEWLEQCAIYVREKRMSPKWLDYFRHAYTEWKSGNEIPESGLPLKTWPHLSPQQRAAVLQARIRTVEELAQANEEALAKIGMGARGMKEKAQQFLASADRGKLVEEVVALRVTTEEQRSKIDALRQVVAELQEKLEAKRKPGRPAASHADADMLQ